MFKRVLLSATTSLAMFVLAGPAFADPPVQADIDVSQSVTGTTPCGTLRWDIHITGSQTTFFDDGVRRRVQAHLHEDNTITNLSTGESFIEGPDSFMQTSYFNPDGTLDQIVATGLAANVQGEQFKDVGRVVLVPRAAAASTSCSPPDSIPCVKRRTTAACQTHCRGSASCSSNAHTHTDKPRSDASTRASTLASSHGSATRALLLPPASEAQHIVRQSAL